VRDARLPKRLSPGKKSMIALEVENTGFGKLLLPSRVDVLLVSGGETVVAPADMPECNFASCSSFSSLAGAEKRRMAAVFAVPKDLTPGSYDLCLRVSAPLKDEPQSGVPRRPIRFANAGMWNEELKANALGKVEVR